MAGVAPQRRLRLAVWSAALAVAASLPGPGLAQTGPADADALAAGFRAPPQDAKPRVWWHWMNGNVTQEGIVADLEWMHRVGIGGAHYFDAGGILANYRFIEPRLVVGDDNWRAAVHLAAETADRLGLELTTAASPGWSLTGGPWVTPAQAMKKYVWSETTLAGGRRFQGVLPRPPTATGVFQDDVNPKAPGGMVFYADALVTAYRLPPAERGDEAPPRLTASGGEGDLARLADGLVGRTVQVVAAKADAPPWIQAEFATPTTIRGLRLGMAGAGASDSETKPRLLISDDGRTWRPGATLAGPADAALKTYGFAPLRARWFRLTLPPAARKPTPVGLPVPSAPTGPAKVELSEFTLSAAGLVDRFVEKAGFSEPIVYAAAPTAPVSADATIAKRDIVDLTASMAADGSLDWTPPPGRWRIIRLGYSLTGAVNQPAPVEATGLEVDKLSPIHAKAYIDTYLDRFERATGKDLIGRRGLQNLLIDSWEAGVQNWTEDLPGEFLRRRGYDLRPWTPVLTGRVVESAEASDRFLWDYRRTLQDLLAQHYAVIAAELKTRGLGLYAEAQGDNWRAIGDGMEIKRNADIPMAEYWYRTFAAGPGQPSLKTDMKESASVAHLYGKPLVANESLTVFAARDPWGFSPAMLKPVVDEIFAYGVNRIVIHTSVHQPLMDHKPGLTLGPFGQYLNRNETWAEQAEPFISYVSRSSYLLQQGRYVADVAYFYGEDRPLVSLFAGRADPATGRYRIEVPDGYGYDFINAQTLRDEAFVVDGAIATRAGARYRVLYMPPDVTALTAPTLRKLTALVEAGAVLAGSPTATGLGLTADDPEIHRLAARLWGAAPGASGVRAVGKGRIYWGRSLTQVLAAEAVAPDAVFTGAADLEVMQLHRRTEAGVDLYYLSNRKDRPERFEASFRAAGRTVELWRADSGAVAPASYRTDGDRTRVPLDLGPNEAVFVVFARPTREPVHVVPPTRTATLAVLDGPWRIDFPAGQGAPSVLETPRLMSWSESADPGVRYFSGTATYSRRLVAPRAWFKPGARLVLDLGAVKDIAEVQINGKPVGQAWKPPYSLDVTDLLAPGDNSLSVKVTNLWANRLIGDAQPGVTHKYTWTGFDVLPPTDPVKMLAGGWRADSPLSPSGLLGPVRILQSVP